MGSREYIWMISAIGGIILVGWAIASAIKSWINV
jgi:hypothetical protein